MRHFFVGIEVHVIGKVRVAPVEGGRPVVPAGVGLNTGSPVPAADSELVGSISVERNSDEQRKVGLIGYMILTPFWEQGIGTEAVRQICGIAFQELALDRIIGQVFPENVASVRVLEKNGFRLEETVVEKLFKSGMARDVKLYRKDNFF